MTNLISHKCHICGDDGEPRLEFSGPHVKMSCNKCGSYVKFIGTVFIPKLTDIRLRIWKAAGENLEMINSIKEEIGFPSIESLSGFGEISLKLLYWELYVKLLKKMNYYAK